MGHRRSISVPAFVAGFLVAMMASAGAETQRQNFPSLTIISGFAPGGGDAQGGAGRGAALAVRPRPVYDLTARLYVRHLPRFLPGRPKVLLQHMPGGGSLRAAKWLLSRRPGSGPYAGIISGQALREMILSGAGKSQPQGFLPVGGLSHGEYVCARRPVTAARRDTIFGATAPLERSYLHARAYSAISPFRLRIVAGYSNTAQIALAFRRGEIDGFCGLELATVSSQLGDQMTSGGLQPLVRFAAPESGAMTQIPLASKAALNTSRPADGATLRAALQFLQWQGAVNSVLLMPPATDRGHLAVLRRAYTEMLSDSDFRRDAGRWGLKVDPVPAAQVSQAFDMMMRLAAKSAALVWQWARPAGQ